MAKAPATVAQAAEAMDLETFPMLPGEPFRKHLVAWQPWAIPLRVTRKALAFQKKTLLENGWKELVGGYLSDQSCSGTFGKRRVSRSQS